MALFFLDTSALVKFYIHEAGTGELLRLLDSAPDHGFAVLSLTQVEFRSAIRKRERMQEIDAAYAEGAIARFEKHLDANYIIQPVDGAILDCAKTLVDRHALRAYDAIQLAACLEIKRTTVENPPTFVCADHDLLHAGTLEGLEVLNPTAVKKSV